MAKPKWYVVTVGRKVGVFNDWLETASYVKGVSGAVYKGFPSEAQARREFAAAVARDDVEIVRDSTQQAPNLSTRAADASGNSAFFRSPSRSGTQPRSQAAHGTPLTGRHSVADRPADKFPHSSHPSSVSRSASEPSPSARRFGIINSYFKKDSGTVGVEARAPLRQGAPASPPIASESPNLRSPRAASAPQTPRPVVKTPSWLASYPRSASQSQLLSPLSNSDLALQTFPAEPITPGPRSPMISPLTAYQNKSPGQQSVGNSSIYISPRAVHVKYEHDVDPRSPIMDQAQVPELSFVSSVSFTRPSPSLHLEQLPHGGLRSSLLFKPDPSPMK